ncbi:alkylation response protein AidB-like acyl-CoA dehydrogenase [Granulicella aggregans]|uniref:Alkylation response protein AidB-like acyl-CoA dehydrogenase n=1 Tax=Granulicella aggregans TaxID=474949 RepID=A0A7W8E5U7_9BACT|nr:alkylation response protein AidB-like acyl-CoA dehydrogenase [Granulicella aggregans]
MSCKTLELRLRELVSQVKIPLPGSGRTAQRHRLLAETAREDISLAKIAEAHWDALAILAEAGRSAKEGEVYAVWASEVPASPLRLTRADDGHVLNGRKPFCSGIGLADRALITVGDPEQLLVEVDLRVNQPYLEGDLTIWQTDAFRNTQTGSVTFSGVRVDADAKVGGPAWYLERPGFWHGACGPAACWAGGVAGLVDFALASKRDDAHTLAHLGAMEANVWALLSLLNTAGDEIDASPTDRISAERRALQLRHMVEQSGSDILRRFSRAYGPQPLSMNESVSRRFQEADLFMRQSHGERDLESLGRLVRKGANNR